ncbi:MAG: tyrosine-protein phosphatase [Cyanobacteria bacterium SZAS-4]|nr:tyrosine-protein phosphatase [Cyanobacteria bacterium SZAS-4]
MLVAVITTTGITPALVSAQEHLSTVAQPTISAVCLSDNEIDNFGRVAPGITRGAQPSDKALAMMAKDGIKTIIDLRMNGSGTENEEATTNRLGMKYVHIPMTLLTPSTEQVSQFLSIVNSPANLPAFVHCRQGADRTGTLVAIYRRKVQGWDFDKTYAEMREHHFKPFLLGMKDLVKNCPNQTFALTSSASTDAPRVVADNKDNVIAKLQSSEPSKIVTGQLQTVSAN